jgi:hypothetical protein
MLFEQFGQDFFYGAAFRNLVEHMCRPKKAYQYAPYVLKIFD